MKLVIPLWALILAVSALTSFDAQAQQPQRISDEQIDATVNAISQQRNSAFVSLSDQVAALTGRLVVLEKALKEAQAKVCKAEEKAK